VWIVVNLTRASADELIEYGAGAKLYLDSSATETGTYASVTSTAIVSGTEQYELTDAAGTSATWYKTQTGNSGGTAKSLYSAAFRATSWAAYATLDDLAETMDIPSGAGSSDRRNLLADLLMDAREQTDSDCGRTFLRVPQVSGTVTVYCDIASAGQASLVSAIGHPYTADGRALDIVSITSIDVRDGETGSYATLGAQDTAWYLDAGYGPGLAGTDWPYEDVLLAATGSRTTWPVGRRAVKIVGALGFPRIPSSVKRANVDLARDAYRAGPGGGPSQMGVNQFGTPIFSSGTPSYRTLVRAGSVYLKRMWRSS